MQLLSAITGATDLLASVMDNTRKGRRMALPSKRVAARKATARRRTLRAVNQSQAPRLDDQIRAFAQCRSLGHEWRHAGRVDEPGTGVAFGAVGLRSVCADCTMERIKWISPSGEVHTRYSQPQGYGLHGDDKLSSKQWRSAFVTIVFGS